MSRKPRGSIHKIREFELEKINLIDEFDILQIVGEGWFGKILLVEHRASQTEMVLKAVPKPYVSLRDFYREFHYGLHLGIHRHVVTTYDVAFETAGFYVFTQEYAPLGDLTSNVTETGVGEVYSKRVAKQIASALDYMHSKDIVHRDVKLDNVLIYRSDFSRVKLCDFGESFQAGTTVERRNEWLPYSPPEVLEIKPEGTYKADPSHDVWQFGIVVFVCLTGCLPWQKAASDDPRYVRYLAWQGAMILPIRRTPKLFKLLSSRAQRMFRRFLEPRSDKRPRNLSDVAKFLDDRWLAKTAEKEMAEYETDELCPSMYSFHSSPDEKNRLLYTLADCGIETNVDRQTKKNRIRDWIESSVINEEDEDENEESASASPSSSISREPVAGHISSIRQTVDKSQEIRSKLKDATQKHFDPRTGALQCGPSEMGVVGVPPTLPSPEKSLSSTISNGDSVCGSLQTLGSGQNLEASNLQLYTIADNSRPHALDNAGNKRFYNQSFSSNDLLTALKASPANENNNQVRTLADASPQRDNAWMLRSNETFQRSKATLYASSPAIDNSHFIGQPNPVRNARPHDPARAPAILNDIGTGTGTGATPLVGSLANFTDTPAQYADPPAHMSVQENQRLYQSYYKWQNNDFQVKDSAYGSTDISESAPKPMERRNGYQVNGNVGHGNQYRQPTTTVRTQNSQRQRLQDDSHGEVVTTKDTAYDRVVASNTNRRKR